MDENEIENVINGVGNERQSQNNMNAEPVVDVFVKTIELRSRRRAMTS